MKQRATQRRNLLGDVLQMGNQVVPVLVLFETTKRHLGAGNVLLGVLEVFKESILVPGDTLLLVRVGVREALDLTGLAAKETVKVGADLVVAALLDGVALSTAGLEKVRTLGIITRLERHFR